MSEQIEEIVVTNESEAFEILERALKNELGDQPFQLKFKGWPTIQIVLEGDGYESTITSDMAAALVEVQHALNRAFARSAHSTSNARCLKTEEKQQIKFKAKVGKGSSLIEINLGEFSEKLASGIMGKMEPGMMTVTVLGVAACAASVFMYKIFLKHRSEDKKIEVEAQKAIALSQEETRRLEVFERAVKANPSLDHVRQDFDAARHEIVRGTSDAKTLGLNGVKLDGATAKVIAMTKRSESKDVQLNGNYFIRKVDWQDTREVRITVGSVGTSHAFTAAFRDDTLHREQIDLLKTAEWDRSQVYLRINATELRGEITTATILEVVKQEVPAVDSEGQALL